jgi:hypothetical protein
LACRFWPRDFLAIVMPFMWGGAESGYETD